MKLSRRISGIVAILAIARLSLGGVVANCAPIAEPDDPPVVAEAHVGHGDAGCGDANPADCGQSTERDCAAMSVCASALASPRWAFVPVAPVPAGVALELRDVRLDPVSAPEPPPPRV